MDSSQTEDPMETPTNPSSAPQDAPEGGQTGAPGSTSDVPPAPPAPLPQAEPGVYLCVAAIAGEHAVLGVLTEGQEYDYTHPDPRTLQAVASYVELGVLEKM